MEFEGSRLTTFAVTPDGKHFRINFTDAHGQPAAVTLPSECLNELLMTLPRMVSQALRAQYKDSSMRLVFPADEWRVETSADGRLILTIGTGGGFQASFSFERSALSDIGDTARNGKPVELPGKLH